jgi:signal transduction histidine kinase
MATSARVAAAQDHGRSRQARERRALRLLGVPLLLVVVIPSFSAGPHVAAHGPGLVVGVALVALIGAFAIVLAEAPRLDDGGARSSVATVPALLTMAAAGVALSARQPSGTGQLALALVSWIAGSRLPLRSGAALVAAATAANLVALAADASLPATAISSSILLAVLLFLMARTYRGAQEDRERAEVAAAELEDARERELESAAVAERSRIARELHDVLAHSLSGLSLQLEGARMTAEREGASPRLVTTLVRCRRLAGQGLEEARRAVRALRGDEVPGMAALEELVAGFRDAGLDVALTVHGELGELRPEASLALYRAAQEALTNVARHSGGARADVELRVGAGAVRLVVTDSGDQGQPLDPALAGAGSGYGLSAMRERARLLGGSVEAGPIDGGFRVELQLPA